MVRLFAAAGRRGVAVFLSLAFASPALVSDALLSGALASGAFPSPLFSTGFASGVGVAVGVVPGVAGAFAAAGGAGLLESSDLAAGLEPGAALRTAETMAGSTGAPLTVAAPVGARRAGGVYLFSRLPSGGILASSPAVGHRCTCRDS